MARGHQRHHLFRLCNGTIIIRSPGASSVLRNHLLQNREAAHNHDIPARGYSSGSKPDNRKEEQNAELRKQVQEKQNAGDKKESIAKRDKGIQEKLAGIAGDGGEAGVEYENGQPVAMKRSVRENMFRYI